MPAGLRQFAEVNPFTIIVDAMRHLWLGAPAHNSVLGRGLWSLVIVAVFAPLAVARYRRPPAADARPRAGTRRRGSGPLAAAAQLRR